jgi:hypothetical protein
MDKLTKLLEEAIILQEKIDKSTSNEEKFYIESFELIPLLTAIGKVSMEAYKEAKSKKGYIIEKGF